MQPERIERSERIQDRAIQDRAVVMGSRAAVYLVFFLSLSLLLSLGGWQWRRGLEKAAIEKLSTGTEDHYITLDRAPPNWSPLAYRRVRLHGKWLAGRDFLLANRIRHSRQGYEVFSPFQLSGDAATLLVNRGWVARPPAGVALSAGLPAPGDATGALYLPQKGFTLGPAYHADQQPRWPKVIQYIDVPALSAALGTALQPAAVSLDPAHPGAFPRIWRAYAMTPARHYAYAAQWWGLAVTLTVFGFIWRRRAAAGSVAGGSG